MRGPPGGPRFVGTDGHAASASTSVYEVVRFAPSSFWGSTRTPLGHPGLLVVHLYIHVRGRLETIRGLEER
jgi:hypothetical protein